MSLGKHREKDVVTENNLIELFGARRTPEGRLATPYEIAVQWRKQRLDVLLAAVAATDWAYSHRQGVAHRHPTRVARYGVGVLAGRPGSTGPERFHIASGWNFKLLPGSGFHLQYHPELKYKLCGEPDGIINALSAGYPHIYGLALFSDNMQPEDVSEIFSNIQHPCDACRTFLERYLTENSPIIVGRHRLPCDLDPEANYLGGLVFEEYTFGDICRIHNHRTGRRK